MPDQLELFSEDDFFEPERSGESGRSEGEADFLRTGLDEELTRIAADWLRRLELEKVARHVSVVWNGRMRTAAGRAFYREARIELNPRLQTLPREQREDETHRTFLHELAHIVSHARHPDRRIQPHGPEWRRACGELGIPDESRCHDLAFTPRRHRRKYGYQCPACGLVIPRVRRIKRPVACRACCDKHNGGRFDKRFVLEEKSLP